MAMNIDYTGIKNSIASTLVADPRFDKTNIAARYVRQVL